MGRNRATSRVRRSTALAAAAMVAASIGLAACSSSSSTSSSSTSGADNGTLSAAQISAALSKPTTITFWTWVSGIQQEVALFEKKYPAIKVNVVNAGNGSAEYTKLRTALTAGSGAPDVAQIEYQEVPAFTTTNNLLDLTPYGADSIKDKFVSWAWSDVSSGGKVYAIPQDTGPMGMLYRADIFAKYKIPVPATWAQFAQDAQKLHAADPSITLTDLAPNDPGAIAGLDWQAGSHPFIVAPGNNLTVNLNDAGAAKVANYWSPLISSGVVSVDPDFTDQWYQALSSGKYATWLTAAWGPLFLQGTAKNTAGDWRVAPLPQWSAGENVSGDWGGSSDAVLKQSKNPIAAAELVQFLNSDPQSTKMLADNQFLFPSTTALLNDPAFRSQKVSFYGGQKVNQIFADISGAVPTGFTWSPFQDYVYNTANSTLGKAMIDKQNLSASLNALQSTVVNYAKQQGFTVKN